MRVYPAVRAVGEVGCSRGVFFQAEDGIRDWSVTGVQTCALPISNDPEHLGRRSLLLQRLVALAGEPGDISFLAGSEGTGTACGLWRIAMRQRLARSEERRVGKEGRCRGAP